MNRIPFYVDNATADSGHIPISTLVLGKLVIIKLGIEANDSEAEVAYQFAHELTHVVFRAYFGMNKPRATEDEETICTAAKFRNIFSLPVTMPPYLPDLAYAAIGQFKNFLAWFRFSRRNMQVPSR